MFRTYKFHSMKKTIDINLGGSPIIIDEDAFELLQGYLNDISSRLTGSDIEIMSDIEFRIAEIFNNNLSLRSQVVDTDMVQKAISVMGRPEEFGEKQHIDEMKQNTSNNTSNQKKLFRNMNDKMIGGVCSGLAAYFNIDTTVVRVVALLLVFFGGVSLWVYIILWIVIPQASLNSGNGDNYYNRS